MALQNQGEENLFSYNPTCVQRFKTIHHMMRAKEQALKKKY